MLFKRKKPEVIHNQFENQPEGTEDVVAICDIIIPEEFLQSKCGHNKIRWAEEYYTRNVRLDKPIDVYVETNERGLHNKLILVDQFSRYLACKKLWVERVPVRYIEIV